MTWKPIRGFPNCEISDCGEIRCNGKVRKLQFCKGYLKIILTKDRKQYSFQVHRIVAEAFLPNPYDLPQVNHKDGNPTNNHVDNLEWCTASENQQHRFHVLRRTHERPVVCVETNEKYASLKEVAVKYGSHIPNIVRACKYGYAAKGFHWKYCEVK